MIAHKPTALELLKEARKIIRASNARQTSKDWDTRATELLKIKPVLEVENIHNVVYAYQSVMCQMSEKESVGTHWLSIFNAATEELKAVKLKFKELL